VVKLTKRACERALATVVRAAHDEHPLGFLEMEVVADDAPALSNKLVP
jgi:hypothetical protein